MKNLNIKLVVFIKKSKFKIYLFFLILYHFIKNIPKNFNLTVYFRKKKIRPFKFIILNSTLVPDITALDE